MVCKPLLPSLFLAFLLTVGCPPVDASAAPPKNTVTLPNVAYDIKLLPIDWWTQVYDVNNNLQVVGHYTINNINNGPVAGFLYDHFLGTVSALPDLISQAEMDSLVAAGFTQSKFRGINDSGVIVGYVGNADWSVADGIIVETQTGVITRSSSFVTFNNSYLLHINNWGDLVGGYHVGTDHRYTFVASYDTQNATYVARDFGLAFPTTLYRSKITDTRLVKLPGPDPLITTEFDLNAGMYSDPYLVSDLADGVDLTCIDSFGRYAGSRAAKGKTFPIAFDPSTGLIWQSTRAGGDSDINDPSSLDLGNGVGLGDILFSELKTGRDPLYLRSPAWGELNLDLLLRSDDPDRTTWLSDGAGYSYVHMTQKLPDTNFGAIAGCLAQGNRPFLLVPYYFQR